MDNGASSYRRFLDGDDKGLEEIVRDYTNADYSKGIAVNVEKNGLPFDFCNLFAIIETRSIVNDVEVGIAQTPIGEMYAEFMYQNVGFRIWASGLTQDEFVAAIESIIK